MSRVGFDFREFDLTQMVRQPLAFKRNGHSCSLCEAFGPYGCSVGTRQHHTVIGHTQREGKQDLLNMFGKNDAADVRTMPLTIKCSFAMAVKLPCKPQTTRANTQRYADDYWDE